MFLVLFLKKSEKNSYQLGFKMNFLAVNNSTLINHRGSVPSVKAATQEVLCPHYQKRCSLDGQKGKTQASSQLKWPSLLTIFKWRQSLEERLLKKHKTRLNCFQVICHSKIILIVVSNMIKHNQLYVVVSRRC